MHSCLAFPLNRKSSGSAALVGTFECCLWCPTVGLARLWTPERQPEAGFSPTAQPGLPFGGVIGQLCVCHAGLSESRAPARPALFFLVWLFFCPLSWDSPDRLIRLSGRGGAGLPVPVLGHLPLWPFRQEPPVDPINVDAARAALAGNKPGGREVGKIAPGGALRDAGVLREGANRWEASAGVVGEADEALHRPAQARLERAIDVKDDGDKGKHGASGLQRNPPGSGLPRVHFTRGKNRACE